MIFWELTYVLPAAYMGTQITLDSKSLFISCYEKLLTNYTDNQTPT